MSLALLKQTLPELHAEGRSVPVMAPVDMLGKCVGYAVHSVIATTYGGKVQPRCSRIFGATCDGKPAGPFETASVLSFNGNKIMTTSGGGMLLTDDEKLVAHVKRFSSQAREPVPHYERTEVGRNYRLPNILALLRRAQLARLDETLKRRREWRDRYRDLFVQSPGVRILGGVDDAGHSFWMTAIIVDLAASTWTAQKLRRDLAAVGMKSKPMWKQMHLQPVSRGTPGTLDGMAEMTFEKGLTPPSASSMSESQAET